MKIFYHMADLDGKCSGYLASELTRFNKKDGYLQPINYGMSFPFEEIREGEIIYILDYSIEPDEMLKLLDITKNVIWIDHHKTAIEKYKDFPVEIKGLRYDGIAACALTWFYFHGIKQEDLVPEKLALIPIPEAVALIADYDTWTFLYDDKTRYFHHGMELENTDIINPDELSIFHKMREHFIEGDPSISDIKRILRHGSIVMKARENMMEINCKSRGFEAEFDGYSAFCLNCPGIGSDDFASIDGEKYDLLIGFSFDGDEWIYSLRTLKPEIDCSAIAKEYGGGGHRGAAGFRSENLLLHKIEKKEEER